MATVEWYDPEAQCVRKERFSGEEPPHVRQAVERAHRFQVALDQGADHEGAKALCDAYDRTEEGAEEAEHEAVQGVRSRQRRSAS